MSLYDTLKIIAHALLFRIRSPRNLCEAKGIDFRRKMFLTVESELDIGTVASG